LWLHYDTVKLIVYQYFKNISKDSSNLKWTLLSLKETKGKKFPHLNLLCFFTRVRVCILNTISASTGKISSMIKCFFYYQIKLLCCSKKNTHRNRTCPTLSDGIGLEVLEQDKHSN
jgi:hypothetical protein